MIAVDVMGGDKAPGAVVEGSVMAAKEFDCPLTLVGDEDVTNAELEKFDVAGLPLTVLHAPEAVGMDEIPTVALRRKRGSSIKIGLDLVKNGGAEAFVSAGNTGAVMAMAMLSLRTIEGVHRPAIAALLPTWKGPSILIDAGANIDCKPATLFQFGLMGSVYAQYILEKESPTVGILSIGEEESKGTELFREAAAMLKSSSINFTGNLEGKEVYRGEADVIVCDGFTGNISLKISESLAEMFQKHMKKIFETNWRSKLGYLLLKPFMMEFKKTFDYAEYGGAPLLGVNGVTIIAHGSSSPKAIKNAIGQAKKAIDKNLNRHISDGLAENADIRDSLEKKRGFWKQIKETILPTQGDNHKETANLDEPVVEVEEDNPESDDEEKNQ